MDINFDDYDEESQLKLDKNDFLNLDEIQKTNESNLNDYTKLITTGFDNDLKRIPVGTYKSPFSESKRPIEGSFIKLDKPLSIFEDDFSYVFRVETLKSGSEVLEAYNKRTPKKREIVFFCESESPEKSNLFRTFVLVKYGEDYKKLIYDLKYKKNQVVRNSKTSVIINSFDDEVSDDFNILTKNYGIDVKIDSLKFVMENELQVTSAGSKTVSEIFGWYNNGISSVVDGLNGWLENVKFIREDYMPKNNRVDSGNSDDLIATAVKGIDYLIPDSTEKLIANTFENILSQISTIAQNNLPKPWIDFLKKVYNTIKGYSELFKNEIKKLIDLGGETFLLGKAVLMGFLNGLITTIQTLLSLIGWLLKTNADKKLTGEYYRELNSQLEFIEDFIDLISEKSAAFIKGVQDLINDFSLKKVKDTLSIFTNKLKEYTIYDYAFFAGSFIFEVVLGVVLAFFTGGASLIAKATNATEKAAAAFRLVLSEVISTATMGITDILKLFKLLITKFAQACSRGWKGFKQFLENLFTHNVDDVVNGEGKVLDNVLGEGLYGGKILSEVEIGDRAKLLLKKFGTKLEKVESFDNPNVLAQFDPNTNTIRYKDEVTEYFMAHESFHAEEMKLIGFDEYVKNAPLRGVKEADYTIENWQRLYKREKYVYDNLIKNAKKYNLNNQELDHAFYYFDGKILLELEIRNIKIPKI